MPSSRGHIDHIARGTIVDEEALVSALLDRQARAFTDVFANEPHVPEALFDISNDSYPT